MIADRGYDSDPLRERWKRRGIELIAPYRKNNKERRYEDGRKLRRYKRRWIIERTNAWLGLGWTPWLRQPNKTLFAVRCKLLDRQDHCTAFGAWPAKRRRALRERNRPRNNRLRLIRTDEGRERCSSLLPVCAIHIGWIDRPCLRKLMRQVAAPLPPNFSPSVGPRTPPADR